MNELEIQLITGLIFEHEKFKSALSILVADDFTVFECNIIFSKLQEFTKDNTYELNDFIKVLTESEKKYLLELSKDPFACLIKPKYLITQIKQNAVDRHLRTELQNVIYESKDIMQDIGKIVDKYGNIDIEKDYTDVNVKKILDFIGEIYKPLDKSQRIYTGYSKLDRALCGLRKRSISCIGARPSVGKTALAINIIKQQIKSNVKTAFFSLEMSTDQILERYCADATMTSYNAISQREFRKDDKERIATTLTNLIKTQSLFIFDDIFTVENIIRTIADIKPEFVVIDFMQIIKTIQKFNSKKEEISHIVREIKRTAMQYNCHIMTLSQIARSGKDDPTMSDLKESGALEELNDYVMMLHRPYVQDKDNPKYKPSDTELIIDKNKYGTTGIIKMFFDSDHQRFSEIDDRRVYE